MQHLETRRRRGRRRWVAAAWGAWLCVLGAACGARTELRARIPCFEEGAVTDCTSGCGDGLSICSDGNWGECVPHLEEEPCVDECGEGARRCVEGEWAECVVPEVELPCENLCGQGVQLCRDGVRESCRVEPVEIDCSNKCGPGTLMCVEGTPGPCSAPQPLPPVLRAVVRDFRADHPDFEEDPAGLDQDIVEDVLGPDDKPVYARPFGSTLTTTGRAAFDQWYRDVPGVNATTEIELPLLPSPSDPRLYVYENRAFFPIDGQLQGNEGNLHNYHFTLEAWGSFVYQGGEIFSFEGDDDLWVFVNRHLVIDLGGAHSTLSARVELDEVASSIGISLGGEYSLHLFFAERHTTESNFVVHTSIAGLGECP